VYVTSHASPFIAEGGHAQRDWAPTCGARYIKNIAFGATNACCRDNLLFPDARDLRIPGAPRRLLAEEKMSIARRSAQAYYSPADPAGGCLWDDLDTACQRMGRDAFNAERARRPSAQWQAARLFLNKCRGCTTFRHGRPGSLCHWSLPEREAEARPAHVSAPDPYTHQSPSRSGTLLAFGLTRRLRTRI
jgi:hypothetical protein